MKKTIYFTDLDGTLLNNKAEISEYSKIHINSFLDLGICLTIATARSYESVKGILGDINFKLPIIEFNGGYITDYNTGEHILINDIEFDLANKVYKIIRESNLDGLISTFDTKDKLYSNTITSEGMNLFLESRKLNVKSEVQNFKSFTDLKGKRVMSFTLIDTKEKIEMIKLIIEDKFKGQVIIEAWEDMYYKPWYWLSIHSLEATKGKAIEKLKEMFEFENSKIVAFGDNSNDVNMFEISDECYAVENAVDELKILSTEVIGSNLENSVVNKILFLEGLNDII